MTHKALNLTLFRSGFFLALLGPGGGLIRPPPLNSKNIKATTTKLEGQIICPKMFPFRSET